MQLQFSALRQLFSSCGCAWPILPGPWGILVNIWKNPAPLRPPKSQWIKKWLESDSKLTFGVSKFFTKFSGLFWWDIQSTKKTSAKTSAQNSHDPAQQNWRNFREKLHDEVLQGDPHQQNGAQARSLQVLILLRFQRGNHLPAILDKSCVLLKKKAHKHKLFCPVGLGTAPGILLILHSGSPISPGLSLGQTQFVPGTIPGTKGGTESLCAFSLASCFVRYAPLCSAKNVPGT